MKKENSLFDIYLAYTDNDKAWTKSLFNSLTRKGYRVFFDKENIKPGENIWEKTFNALLSSKQIAFVISKNAVSSNWEKLEIIAEIWLDILKRKKKSLIITLSESRIPAIIKKSSKIIDAQEDSELEDVVDEIAGELKTSKQEKKVLKKVDSTDFKQEILKSLRIKLRFNFLMPELERKQFDTVYEQFTYLENLQIFENSNLKNNSDYYISYWGYKAAKLLDNITFEEHSASDSNFIHSKFFKKLLIEIPFKSTGDFKTIKSVKHTLWAIELLLLLEHNLDFVQEVFENLIEKSDEYMNSDGGWKDYLFPGRNSSLLTSLYAFCLFSRIKNHKELIDIPKSLGSKLKKITEQTENYILSQWYEKKWVFSNLHWKLAAINIFIHFVQFSENLSKIKEIFKVFEHFVNEKGVLRNSQFGLDFYVSEYILSVRIAYTLKSGSEKTGLKFHENLTKTLIENYSHEAYMSPCDIYFLTSILKN